MPSFYWGKTPPFPTISEYHRAPEYFEGVYRRPYVFAAALITLVVLGGTAAVFAECQVASQKQSDFGVFDLGCDPLPRLRTQRSRWSVRVVAGSKNSVPRTSHAPSGCQDFCRDWSIVRCRDRRLGTSHEAWKVRRTHLGAGILGRNRHRRYSDTCRRSLPYGVTWLPVHTWPGDRCLTVGLPETAA